MNASLANFNEEQSSKIPSLTLLSNLGYEFISSHAGLILTSRKHQKTVFLHELCHIAEHNHSGRFWRLLTQVRPNWKAVK
ncbi:M48 metallopeptidase family protein [Marinomonas lutimaris]|jgi:hypothetical protein|uniref:M48 metallopeptidase family protein n=1 Tax=Marinomonas lutimaris TaxID=2846746 RepID=UPI00201775D1|nr:M48 family metallopeptidase [Marinomonas lutimaris]